MHPRHILHRFQSDCIKHSVGGLRDRLTNLTELSFTFDKRAIYKTENENSVMKRDRF